MDSPFALDQRELRVAARLGFVKDGSVRTGRLAAALVAVAWLPLLILTLAAGTAYGNHLPVPFLADFLPYGRYLIALPLLILVHPIVNGQVALAIADLQESGLVSPDAQAAFQEKLVRAQGMWRSPTLRIALASIAILVAFLAFPAKSAIDVPDWMMRDESGSRVLGAAGWWTIAIGGSLIRLLLLFALWKLLIWSWFLRQLARMPLHYQPLHADGCAGLGILERVQVAFSCLAAALSIQFGCVIADAVNYRGHEIMSYKLPAAAFVVLILALLFAPLLVFLRPLTSACIQAEMTFRIWTSRAAQQVGNSLQQTGDEAISSRLSSPEISTMADASALYAGALRTRKIPVTARALQTALAATILPMFLPLLPLLPLKQMATRLVGIVL